MSGIEKGMPHDEMVVRQVLGDIDSIARQIAPTQGVPPGQKALTQAEEDAIWDDFDPAMAAQIPAMRAQGMPDLLIATMVFPKRMQLIKRGRPTLTEQSKYAAMMAKRADERMAGMAQESMGEVAPPDTLDMGLTRPEGDSQAAPEPLPMAA